MPQSMGIVITLPLVLLNTTTSKTSLDPVWIGIDIEFLQNRLP